MAKITDFWFEPDELNIKVNTTYHPVIMGRFDDGSVVDITGDSDYLSDPVILNQGYSYLYDISSNGEITAKAMGKGKIKAWGDVHTLINAAYGTTGGNANFTNSLGGSQSASSFLPGYPPRSAWEGSIGGVSSGHWGPKDSDGSSGNSSSGWLGLDFYTPTIVNSVSYEPTYERNYASLSGHYVSALINGSWRTFSSRVSGSGLFGSRYIADINEEVMGIRIHISGRIDRIPPNGSPGISIIRPYVSGKKEGIEGRTVEADITISGYPHEITIDPKDNPSDTEYYVERSLYSDFRNRQIVSQWKTDTTITSEVSDPSPIYYYRVKARNSKGVETDWEITSSQIEDPLELKITEIKDKEILLEWNHASNSVDFELVNTSTEEVVYAGSDLSYKHEDLTPDTIYTYALIAKKGDVRSGSIEVSARTHAEVPDLEVL